MTGIRLIVGLGNPGRQYAATRHNVGFMWVERLAGTEGAALKPEARFHGLAGRLVLDGRELWLLQPQTFMNVSGRAVAAFAHFYRLAPEEVLVVHDELDLPPGTVRLKQGGGHGGHNGLKDIVAHLHTPAFWRLRFGIGHPGEKDRVADYVLLIHRCNVDIVDVEQQTAAGMAHDFGNEVDLRVRALGKRDVG